MFTRNEKGRLKFERLDFESFIYDLIDQANPKDEKDLRWVVKVMIDSLQLTAWDYANDELELNNWEDVYYPSDCY